MDRRDMERKILTTIQRIQELSGATKENITSDTCPIRDLSGFDSLRAIETSSLLESEFGCDLSDNVFISEDGKRGLRISEIVDRIERKLKEGE